MSKAKPFSRPIYITRPILPDLNQFKDQLEQVWQNQWLTNNGLQHQQLEKKLRSVLQVSFLSLFNNGTNALLTALKILNLQGEVIPTPFTFPATPHAISWNNLQPVFCDIDPKTMNIDTDKIESLITKKTSAILAVHVFGTPCNVKKIKKIADKHKLKVIYDAAHAFGVKIDNKSIGNFGDITMFSFHATKLFHTAEGGALACKSKRLKKKIDLLKNFGIVSEERVIKAGINSKMNEIQAVLGLLVLKHWRQEKQKRAKLFKAYQQCLKNIPGITIIDTLPNIIKSFQYLVIRINQKEFGRSRDYVYEHFKKYNVFTRKYFYPLCSQYPHYKNLPSAAKSNLSVAHQAIKEVISMPFYGRLSALEVKKICRILKSFRS